MPPEAPKVRDFTTLYQATLTPLRRYLARLLGNAGEAQDVAHDAYVRIYPTLQQNHAERPESLLYVTARRLALNRIRRRRISPLVNVEDAAEFSADQGPGTEAQVIARQEKELLQKAIEDLPAGCRQVLLLRKVELLSHKEIGERLGIAVSTVEKQHARALRLLKQNLEELSWGELGVQDKGERKEGGT